MRHAIKLGDVVVAVAGRVRTSVVVAAVDATISRDVHGAVFQEKDLVDVRVDAVGKPWGIKRRCSRLRLLVGT